MSLEVYFEPKDKVTQEVEGKNITLNNSSSDTVSYIKLNGETSQATRSGINLINVTATTTTTNGVTCTVNKDKSITLNGTNDGTTSWFRLGADFTLPAGTYTLSNGNPEAIYSKAIFYDDAHNFATANITTATFTSNVTIKPYIRINAGASFNNLTIYPMIVEGTYTAETMPNYEQYGVMPSPDYPSEIENLEGKNKLSLTNNTYTNRGITAIVSNGIITLSGTSNDSSMASIIDIPLINPILSSIGTVIKSLNPTGTYTGVQTSLRASNTATSVGLWSNNAATQSGTLSGNAYYLRIQINYNTTVDCILKPQIEERSISNRICSI